MLGLSFYNSGCKYEIAPNPLSTTDIYKNDSLKVQRLLKQGETLYRARNSMDGIGESLLYFDSANKMATGINDTLLMANALYYIGNVYNAWNGEPQKTLDYYQQSASLFNSLPLQKEKQFYLRYIIAHGYDKEKANDSSLAAQTIAAAMFALKNEPRSFTDTLKFITDFAWVASNISNYKMAEEILENVKIHPANDPETNNYLDHYYLTKAKIDINYYGKKTVYLDSLKIALKQCDNRFDSGYYASNLSKLYAASGNYEKAYFYNWLASQVQLRTSNSDVLTVLRTNLLDAKLQTEKEKEKRTRDETKIKNVYLYSIIIIGLLLAGLFSIYKKRKREQEKNVQQQFFTSQLLQKTEETRRRIAMELHDGVNHELLSLKNNLILQQPLVPQDVESIIKSIRYVSHNLYPALFEAAGFQASLEVLCNKTTEMGCFTSFSIEYEEKLITENELQLYRIVQEALQNVAKHAHAEACRVTVIVKKNYLFTEIKDNGKGFTVAENFSSFGLETMRQRALALHAKLQVKSSEAGTIITLFTT